MSANTDYRKTLEIESPLVTCGHCRFTSRLLGTWTVEDGWLVWRADADPQPNRGPDLWSCCESSPVIRFKHIDADGKNLSDEEIAALRETAEQARLAEFADWEPP